MTEITWKKGANLLYSRLPDFIRESYPNYVEFLKVYYEHKDTTVRKGIVNFLNNRDIDLTEEKWLDLFHDEYAIDLPKVLLEDPRLVYKFIKDFYRAKGTENATRFLFRVIFNEEIDFYYPGRDMFRASDSKWTIDKSLKVTSFIDKDIFDLVGKRIIGATSQAYTKVERAISYVDNTSTLVYELFYVKTVGTFQENESLFDENNNVIGRIEGLIQYPGKYIGFNGHASSFKKIQDSYYYQAYSYVIKSGQPLSKYKNLLVSLTHPAGTRVFAEFAFNTQLSTTQPTIYFEDKTLQINSINIASLVPYIWSDKISTDAHNLTLMVSVPLNDRPTVVHNYLRVEEPVSGKARISTTEQLIDIASLDLQSIASWKVEDFTNTKGFIANTASWDTDFEAGDYIKITSANGEYYYNTINSIDSSHTMTVRLKSIINSSTNLDLWSVYND